MIKQFLQTNLNSYQFLLLVAFYEDNINLIIKDKEIYNDYNLNILEQNLYIRDKKVTIKTKSLFKEVINKDLASELIDLFPKGKKDGKWYWRGSKRLITERLTMFYKKYGEFPNRDIIKATVDYVKSFDLQYEGMSLLKYFIFKSPGESILMEYLENIEEEDKKTDSFMNIPKEFR